MGNKYKDGMHIPIDCFEAYYVRGHVTEEEFREALAESESVGEDPLPVLPAGASLWHRYGRFECDARSEHTHVLAMHGKPGRGEFPVTEWVL